VELRCPEWWGMRGHELEDFEDWTADLLRRNGKSPPPEFPTARTVGDLVNELEAVLSNKDER